MIPILFNKDEKTFTSLGLGQMDATLVEVERERNGNYTLYAEVPFNSPQAKDLTKEMLIKADAGSRTKWQTFKINRTIKDTNADVIKVYADHISMDTINDAINPKVVITQMTAEGALRQWANSLVSGKAYDVQSDITHVGSTEWTIDEVENARQALGGVSGSILDVWGGEYEFDNNTIILHKEMGRTAPTVLEYGRNIVSLEYEELIDGVYTSIYPYATYTPKSEDNKQLPDIMVTLDELIVDSEYAGNYETRRIQIVDFSGEFDSNAENPEIPTQAKLRTLAKAYVKNNGYGIPKISQEIDFVDLSKTLDYQDIQVMEEIELNDRVPVYYPNIDAETNDVKVTMTNWDVLNNRYSKITLSTIGAMNSNSITSKLNTAIKDLKAEQKKINNTVPYLINGQGNRVWHTTPDENMEHKIDDTWFKKNGKYTIIYRWNGSMWEEVLNDETFITEIEAGVSTAIEEVEKAVQSAQEADARASEAIEKAGANASLLSTHQNTLDTIKNTTIPNVNKVASDAMAEAKSALSSASSAMDEAKKADDKIADYVTKNGLVNGITVDTKINEVTGEWTQNLSKVESKIEDIASGGRNLIIRSDPNYTPKRLVRGTVGSVYELGMNIAQDTSGFIPLDDSDKYFTLSKKLLGTNVQNRFYVAWLRDDNTIVKFQTIAHDSYTVEKPEGAVKVRMSFPNNAEVKFERGQVATSYSLAPEDNYTQYDFSIFEANYNTSVEGINSTLTEISNKKLDSTTYTTFYNNEYKKTAQGVTDAYTKLNKIIDANGNSTDAFAKAVYERNATRQSADFKSVTDGLVKTATYESGINGVKQSITSVRGDLDKLSIGGQNLIVQSNITRGKYLTVTGSEANDGAWFYTDFIPVSNYKNLVTSGYSNLGNAPSVVYYNSSKAFVKGINNATLERAKNITIDDGISFIRFSGMIKDLPTLKLAPDDMLGKADFQVFKNTYESNDKTIKSRLTAIDSGKAGSVIYNANEALKTAKGNTSSITSLNTKVDNLKIGGRNLISGTDDLNGIFGYGYAGSSITYQKNYKISANEWGKDTNATRVFVTSASGTSGVFTTTNHFKMIYGKPYTVSFYVKNLGSKLIQLSLNGLMANPDGTGWQDIKVGVGESGKFSATGYARDNPDWNWFQILLTPLDGATSMDFAIAYLQVEEGTFATDWTPALADQMGKAEFTLFKNEYDSTSKSILNRLTAIDSSASGSVVTRLNKTESTASGNKTTISNIKTKPGEQITGYQTILERSNLYERVIGSSNEATVKQNMARIVMTDSVFQTEVVEKSDINTRIANATSLSIDPNFEKGLSGVTIYDNSNSGNVSLVHVKNLNTNATHSSAPTNDSMLEVVSKGQASPNRGGFRILANGDSSIWYEGGEYVLEVVGRLNSNATLELSNNALGTGGQLKWITDNRGKGDYFKYQAYAKLGKGHHSIPIFYISIKEPGNTTKYYQFTRVEAFDLNYTSSSKITQLADNINLKVSKGDLLSQINVQAGGVLITSGTNKLNVTPTTTYIENGTIKSAMIESLDAGKVTTGELDAGKVKVVNLDANSITGNLTEFIKTNWNEATGGGVTITGGGVRAINSEGSRVTLENGVVSVGNRAGVNLGFFGDHVLNKDATGTMTITASYGTETAFISATSTDGKTYRRSMSIMSGAGEIDMFTTLNMNKNSLKDVTDIGFTGGLIKGNISGSARYMTIDAGTGTSFDVSGTTRMSITSVVNIFSGIDMRGKDIASVGKLTYNSDQRLKTNIKDTNIRALDAIRNWQLVSYDWLESGEHVEIGLIAQNSPEVMIYNEENDIYGIDAGKQTMINTLAIQQLDSKTNDEISQLKAQVASLQDELALLKGA